MRGLLRFTLTQTALALCLAIGFAPAAYAQFTGALGVQSDYRYRGISLTERRPVVTLDLAYDHPSGFYAGASAIGVDEYGPRSLGFIEYAGFATPRIGPASLDFGVDNQNLSGYAARRYPLNYSEIYAGVAISHVSAHIYYSPNYFRPGVQTLYADVEGSFKPAENWRLFGHVGATTPVGGPPGRRQRYDAKAGVARQFGPIELQAALTATTPAPPGPPERTALIFVATWFF